MHNKILTLAIRTIHLMHQFDRIGVFRDLVDQEGPLVALQVFDHISHSIGGPPVTDEMIDRAFLAQAILDSRLN